MSDSNRCKILINDDAVIGEVLFIQDWDFILYKIGNRYLLNVTCDGIATIERCLFLTDDEIVKYRDLGITSVEAIARRVQNNRDFSKERNIRTQVQFMDYINEE